MSSQHQTSEKKIRSCGSCTACCIILRIDSEPGYSTCFDNGEDIAKPAGQPCRFLTPQGCGIYETRPLVCRNFKCDWLKGRRHLKTEDHPLKIGYFEIKGSRFSCD